MRYKNLLSAEFSSFFFLKCFFPFAQDDVRHPPSRTSPQGLWYHSPGFAVTPAHLHLNSEKPTQMQHQPSGKLLRWLVNNSLVCQANKETHSTVKHQSQKRPGAGAHPWRKGCWRWRWGDGGSLFIPSATAWNIHAADIPQRKHHLVQMHPSTGDIESVAGAHLRGSLKCRFSSTQRIQAHIPELNQGPATTGLGRWENTKLLFSE